MDADALSRPIATAQRLGDLALDRHRFIDKRVLLTGEAPILQLPNGRSCLLSSLRLLLRICRNVVLRLPVSFEALYFECQRIANAISPDGLQSDNPGLLETDFDAVLNVGCTARPELPWTSINSCGWLARVTSESRPLEVECGVDNPMGALVAACMGVSEVFKRLIGLKQSRGKRFNGLSWSLFSYSQQPADDGPAIPARLSLEESLLVGAGAIGQGVLYLLDSLPLYGNLRVIDPQLYGPENLGTCLLLERRQVGMCKVDVAKELLAGKIKVDGYREEVAAFKRRLGEQLPFPRTVIGALDNIEARHELQRLWPDIVFDGAIGEFACQVSRHRWADDEACLCCMFRHSSGEKAEFVASRASGLALERVTSPEDVVGDVDIERAPAHKREWLAGRKGRTICSVVQEAVATEISGQPRKGFAPSVPFVACFSAAMIAGELVKHLAGWKTNLESRYQLDLLRGPAHGQMVPQLRSADCVCVTRAANINRWRESR